MMWMIVQLVPSVIPAIRTTEQKLIYTYRSELNVYRKLLSLVGRVWVMSAHTIPDWYVTITASPRHC